MDGEVLIIGKVVGWSGGVPKGLPSVEVRTWAVICGGLFFLTFFRRVFLSEFLQLGAVLKGFGRPKWE